MANDLSACTGLSGRNYRKCANSAKQIAKTEARQFGRSDRAASRATASAARSDAKAVSKAAKFESFSEAYKNGIDPRASMWQGLSDITGSVATAASSIMSPSAFGSVLGGGMHNNNGRGRNNSQDSPAPLGSPSDEPNQHKPLNPKESSSNGPFLLLGALGLAYFLNKR